jgi:4-hydroxy-4-methyl-2-oxoglutarate aldolase
MNHKTLKEICQRFGKLYTGIVADTLDKKGYRNQVLPYDITPITIVNRVAGFAFTGQGSPCDDPKSDDTQMRLDMLETITPHSISVWACGGHAGSAHWGEIMSKASRQQGCQGAVIDGGVRDVDFINRMKFPVFARFKSSASSIGRWEIREYQVPIKIGDTPIFPGDFILGDTDGVVVIPKDLIREILSEAEALFLRERDMRRELRKGASIKKAYKKYGAF